MNRITLLLILSVTIINNAFAQQQQQTSNFRLPNGKEFDRWSVGVSVGLSHLAGDLLGGDAGTNRVLEQGDFGLSYGAQVHYQASHSIGIRARVMLSKFLAHDQDQLDTTKGANFNNPYPFTVSGVKPTAEKYESPLTEGALEMTYNFGNISFLDRNKNFHFVATLGLGFFDYDGVVRKDSANDEKLRSSSGTELMIPMSLGFKYKINKVDVGLAFDFRKTFTDHVDATYKIYSEYDNYMMVNLGINYTFGKKNKPMEWVNPMEVVYNDLAEMKEKVDIMSGDKDKDGVSDLFDKDNSTAEGTKVYGDGTAVDTDGDGVPDGKDSDPFTPKGAKVDANGMEMDTDKDGVADSRDLEPNTMSGTLVNFQGISIPVSGKDGAAGSDGSGAGFLPSIFFDLGSSAVKSVYHDRVLVIAKILKNNPSLKLKIIGNTDVSGNEASNSKLGQKRADAVKKHLETQYGIDGSRLSAETKGETEPAANKLNTMNRRVDFEVE